jgi:uncharacterized protein (UPF0332 family)
MGKIIARLQDQREDADYDASAQIEPEQARELVNQSKRFIERMSAYLTSRASLSAMAETEGHRDAAHC